MVGIVNTTQCIQRGKIKRHCQLSWNLMYHIRTLKVERPQLTYLLVKRRCVLNTEFPRLTRKHTLVGTCWRWQIWWVMARRKRTKKVHAILVSLKPTEEKSTSHYLHTHTPVCWPTLLYIYRYGKCIDVCTHTLRPSAIVFISIYIYICRNKQTPKPQDSENTTESRLL